MPNFQESYLSGSNIEFIEGLYARYLESPESVDASWRGVFESNRSEGQKVRPIFVKAPPTQIEPTVRNGAGRNGHAPEAASPPSQGMELQSRVDQTVYAFRLRGHLLAKLDPLGRPRPALDHIADLGMVSSTHFTGQELEQVVDSSDVFAEPQVRLGDLLNRLRQTYCEHIGVEFMNLLDSDRRRWLMRRMEHCENRRMLTLDEQKRTLMKLSYAETFEGFLHTKYVTAKRFSLEGSDSLVPMLDAFLEEGGKMGVKEVVVGMAHRGRLNILTNILGKTPFQIFNEFEGPSDPSKYKDRGDVKYHQGFSSDHQTVAGTKIHLSLAFNPSHLEVVDPVVEGRVRAKQDRVGDAQGDAVVPLLIHGDAAFAGQGLVAETLNLSQLKGYFTGGTVHIVVNNQVGFTTDPDDSRSSLYCTSMAQMLDIPVFHVNGDDPEACVHVMRLVTEYRQTFKTDVIIDLVSFRRYGHNEGDEPAFTQPDMYALIDKHPTTRKIYAEQLIQQKKVTADDAEAIRQKCIAEFQAAHAKVREARQFTEPSFLQGLWKNFKGGPDKDVPEIETGVTLAEGSEILNRIGEVPAGFTPHPKIIKLLEGRKAMASGKQALDWSAAESLAYGSLLKAGYSVRLTGQDTERGTFTHRHAVLHDVKTGGKFTSLQQFARGEAKLGLYNSPLSEMGCLGFEFGYSLDYPDALVIWEAQFGDFANNAQVIIDQFISAAEDKWYRLSGLTLFLPHGYEGQGPEHSSARLERFLGLCAEDNIQVCYPTTPAQIFHLVRRQTIRPWRKPLVVMSPKSLLRKPEVVSPLEDFTRGTFQRLIADKPEISPGQVERLLLCSGKVYYDLVSARDNQKDSSVSIARLEQLYPFPKEQLVKLLESMPKLKEIFWVQEEPKNMGGWRFMFPLLHETISSLQRSSPTLGFIGRVASASPATGFIEAHHLEQKLIVEEAVLKGLKNVR